MSRASNPPVFSTEPPGPWGVDTIGGNWCVIHRETLRAKAIGPVGPGKARRVNYFDRALEEATKRNRKP